MQTGKRDPYKYKMPNVGETVHIHSGGNFIYPHGLALYLGADKTGLHKILLPSYVGGWIITDMDGLYSCRPIGLCNIRHTKTDEDGSPTEYDYIVYDKKVGITMELRKVDDIWIINNEFDSPSWVGGEKKKDKWIMPDPESFDVKNDPEAIEQDEYKIVAEI